MRASIRRFHSPDISDLGTYKPEKADTFGFLLQVIVGPAGLEGEESFDIEVCTPKWLLQNYGQDDIVFGRHHIVVFEYQYDRFVDAITSYVETCEGASWDEVAQKLSEIGRWEFEDYSPPA